MRFIDRVKDWDKKEAIKYNGFGGKIGTGLFKFFSFFGRETLWFLLIAYFILIWYDSAFLIYIGTTFMNGLFLILPIKQHFNRARPFEEIEEIRVLERRPTSKSFPSWHSYNVVSQALILGTLLHSIWLGFLLMVFATIVAFSRVQLGVHYPSDVIVGGLLGIVGFILTIYIMNPIFSWLIGLLEKAISLEIFKQQFDPLLFTNPYYTILCIAVFTIIILSYFNKRIMKWIFKK